MVLGRGLLACLWQNLRTMQLDRKRRKKMCFGRRLHFRYSLITPLDFPTIIGNMDSVRLELGLSQNPASDAGSKSIVKIPFAWFKRKRSMIIVCTLFLVVCLWAVSHSVRLNPSYRSGMSRIDNDVERIIRKIPGAIPGIPVPNQAKLSDYGRSGETYPSKEDLLIVLMGEMLDPSFRVDNSTWIDWQHWVSGNNVLPNDAHVQFLTRLKSLNHGDISDAQLYLEHPVQWSRKHLQNTPLTVFSKSYCPYSRGAKELLATYNARLITHEVDLRGTSQLGLTATKADAHSIQPLLWDLTGHRTYPKVIAGSKLLVRHLLMNGPTNMTGWP